MKILLTGDSWASGDWNSNPPLNVLSILLNKDRHEVFDFSNPSMSDWPSLATVNNYVDQVDCVIFFKTQITRILSEDFSQEKYNARKGNDWPLYEDYQNENFLNVKDHAINEIKNSYPHKFIFKEQILKNKNLVKTLNIINQLVVYEKLYQHNKKLILIGGIEKIETGYNFKHCIVDLVEFLTGFENFNFTLAPSHFENIHNIIQKLKCNLDTKNQLMSQLNDMFDNDQMLVTTLYKCNNFFGPNDFVHPNKNAIELYYKELIKPKLKEIENDCRTSI